MKLRAALCLMLAILLAAFGCTARTAGPKEDAAPGYLSFGEVAYGGNTQPIGGLNAKSLSVIEPGGEDAQTALRFEFVAGSRMSGDAEERADCGVPAYSVYTLDDPARLVVELEGLAYWDYRHAPELTGQLLRGTFQHAISDGSRMRIYFQLDEPVYFKASAEGDTLSISLLPKKAQQQTQYYVTANAFEQYSAGIIPAECAVAPTLAANLRDILLISSPFATEEEAAALAQQAQQLCPTLPEGLFSVVSLQTGELPTDINTPAYLKAAGTPAVRLPDGSEKTLPVLAPDGLYLCSLPGNQGFLFSREVSPAMGDAYQQLYKMRWDGQESLATSYEFSSIEDAQYSPDGRNLAVLERMEGSTHLYVFDADTYELVNDLSGMGFGGNTSTFLWNSLGNTIYAITGVSGIELHQYDYSIPDETNRHGIVDGGNVDEGSLGYCNGELYFAHATMEEGSTIYRIKPEGGVRKPFSPGSRFAISGDAQYIAIVDANEGGSTAAALKLYETASGSTRTITSDFYPYDCIFSQDCTRLYYIESRISGGQTEDATSDDGGDTDDAGQTDSNADAAPSQAEPYPYTLWVYDIAAGQSQRLLDIAAPGLFAGDSMDVLYLNRYEADETGTLMRATYLLDLASVFSLEPGATPEA